MLHLVQLARSSHKLAQLTYDKYMRINTLNQ